MPDSSDELLQAVQSIPVPLRVSADTWTEICENYVGGLKADATEYAFPGLSRNLSHFPPTYIDNCEFDELRSSGEAFAEQLRTAGVHVEHRATAGVLHGHLNHVGFAPTMASLDRLAERLTRPLQRP
jgi:acetyl esterase/lipase